MGYFGDRFDFEIVGVIIPGGSTLADPSSGELAELVETMEDEGVTVIFGETVSTNALAEAVAAELGEDVEVVELYTGSLGDEGSGACSRRTPHSSLDPSGAEPPGESPPGNVATWTG